MMVSKSEFARIKRKAAARKERREQKRLDSQAIAALTDNAVAVPLGESGEVGPLPRLNVFGPPKRQRRAISPLLTKKRRKPSERKRLIAKLDAAWSLLVRLRDKKLTGGLCRICGIRPIEVGYHIVPRQSHATRWLPEAGCGACSPCNLGEMWHRLKYRQKHIEIFGAELVEGLEAKARTVTNFKRPDLEAILADLKSKLEERDARPQA